MFCAGADVDMYPKRALARSYIFNVHETITLYYNCLITVLCRDKKASRQGACTFAPSMIKLLLSIIVLSCAPVRAADNTQQVKPEVKTAADQDSAFIRARKDRLAEISAHVKTGGAAAVASLKKLQGDKDPLVRGEAVAALGRTKDPSAFAALAAVLKSTDTHSRWGAVDGLAQLTDGRAVPLLISALGHADRTTRWKAAEALGALKDARAADALVSVAMAEKDKNVRLAAIEALMGIGGAKAEAALSALKNDPDPEIKAKAAAGAAGLRRK